MTINYCFETKIDQDETQTRPLRPERDQKETYSRLKGDLFATRVINNLTTT
jgi:hypothetical protein